MPFCINCGKALADSAKFCFECGAPVNGSSSERKTVYEGEIHKCPNCGEVLEAFAVNCPACGYELRGSKTTSAVQEFVSKLNSVTTEYQKTNIIRSFPIPNTKEDIFEFMILASSNIDVHPNKGVFDAWIAKFEQCYDKAKLSFKHDSDFIKIQSIYDRTIKEIKRIKRKGPLKKFLMVAVPIIAFIVINIAFWSWVAAPDPKAEAKEVARLEAIVVEVEQALQNKEYDLAMMHAKSIDYSAYKSNDELERQWDIKRDYLIKKVISTAAEDGIEMTYPTDTADEKDQEKNSSTQDYKQNIEDFEDFNEQMEDVKEQWNNAWNGTNTDKTITEQKTVKNFTLDIPDYWKEEGSKNEYLQYYAEKGDKVVMLSIAYPKESDDNYDVSFNGLYADNENMINAVSEMFTDGDVIDYEILKSDYGVKGILYHFTYNQEIDWFTDVDGSGYCFCFPSEKDRRWFYVTLIHTNNVQSDKYKNDYMKMISAIQDNS